MLSWWVLAYCYLPSLVLTVMLHRRSLLSPLTSTPFAAAACPLTAPPGLARTCACARLPPAPRSPRATSRITVWTAHTHVLNFCAQATPRLAAPAHAHFAAAPASPPPPFTLYLLYAHPLHTIPLRSSPTTSTTAACYRPFSAPPFHRHITRRLALAARTTPYLPIPLPLA